MTVSTLVLMLMLQAAGAAAAQAPTANADYTIGAQDKLSITVVGIPELSQAGILVDNEGMIAYLDLGRLKAEGKTARQLQADVRQFLIDKHQHTNPTVIVEIAEFRPQTVYVSGAVTRPLGYQIKGTETLMNVLAQAGFAPSAGQRIQVVRNKPTHQEFTFDRHALENGSAPPFQLQDGDSIIVAEAEKAMVRGEVKSPGLFEVSSDTSVLQLIVMAGDFTDRAAKGKVKLYRNDGHGKLAKAVTIKSSEFANTIVKPGDVVEVGRRIL